MIKKLLLGLVFVLIIGFSVLWCLVNLNLRHNAQTLTNSVKASLDQKMTRLLDEGTRQTASDLDKAAATVEGIVLATCSDSYNNLARSVANQIFPMVENFDLEGAGKTMTGIRNDNPSIVWARYITKDKPQTADIYEFGKQSTAAECVVYSAERKSSLNYLKVELQVDLAGLKSLTTIKTLFHDITQRNQERNAQVVALAQDSLETTKKSALNTAAQQARQSGIWIALLMVGTLVVITIVVWLQLDRYAVRDLRAAIKALEHTAAEVLSYSGNVATTSGKLAADATDQAASLQQTSASLEEMSGMTQRNSDDAQTAIELAQQAHVAAEAGAADMQSMSVAMNEIKASSHNIAAIIKTIEEIAFQTNILALNAAVEAARAGEAGTGFAVVAEEVRSLAQRSAHAAKETNEKIQDSIQKSECGVAMSEKVGQGLQKLVTETKRVDELITQIATASREQSHDIVQINSAASQMDCATQHNAGHAQASATAAQQLNAQATALKAIIQQLVQVIEGNGNTQYTV